MLSQNFPREYKFTLGQDVKRDCLEDLLGQRQAAARKMLPDVRDTALVYAGKERRSLFRKKREQAEQDNQRAIGDNSGLGPVSYELTNGLEPLLAVWSIREAISAIF